MRTGPKTPLRKYAQLESVKLKPKARPISYPLNQRTKITD
jgi:hypothetical protein